MSEGRDDDSTYWDAVDGPVYKDGIFPSSAPPSTAFGSLRGVFGRAPRLGHSIAGASYIAHRVTKKRFREGSETVQDLLRSTRLYLAENESRFLIKPNSYFSRVENSLVLMCMLWILLITPFEVGVWIDPYNQRFGADVATGSTSRILFVCNVLLEVILILDIGIHFFKAYEERLVLGTVALITDAHDIVRHYFWGYFKTDLISAVPFTFIFWASNKDYYQNPYLGLCLLLRMSRLVKLKKMLYELSWFKALMQRTRFTTTSLARYAVILILLIHFIACSYAFCAKVTMLHCFYPDEDCIENCCEDPIKGPWVKSWVGKYFENQDVADGMFIIPFEPQSNFKLWLLSVYWAAMTITSIGYGDVTPYNVGEFTMVTVSMLVMGFAWTYMIGAVAGMVATASKKRLRFEEDLEDVNNLIRDARARPELAEALRTYVYSFHHNRVSLHSKYSSVIKNVLSPGLKGDVAMADQGTFLQSVWYLRDIDLEISSAIATAFRPLNYAKYDIVTTTGMLTVMRMGLGAMMDRSLHVLSTGSVWGLDFVLHNSALVETYRVRCLTFMEVLVLSKADLHDIFDKYPGENFRKFAKTLKYAAVKIAFRRWLVLRALEKSEKYRLSDAGISSARALASTSAFLRSNLNPCFHGMNDAVRLKNDEAQPDPRTRASSKVTFKSVENPQYEPLADEHNTKIESELAEVKTMLTVLMQRSE